MSNTAPNLEWLLGEAGRLQRLAYSILHDVQGAEDVAQEAAMVALDRAPEGLSEGGFRAWIGTVARNLALNRYKRERSQVARESAVAWEGTPTVSTNADDRLEAQRDLAKAVLGLEEGERELVVMRYFDELPPQEIARRLGMTPAAASSALYRSLQKLRQRMVSKGHGSAALALVAGELSPGPALAKGVGAASVAGSGLAIVGWVLAAAAVLFFGVSIWIAIDKPEPSARGGAHSAVSVAGGQAVQENAVDLAALSTERSTPRTPAGATGAAEGAPALAQPEPPRLTLQVRVQDASGRPLSGVAVGPLMESGPKAYRRDMDVSARVTTDREGAATIVVPWEPDEELEGRQQVLLLATAAGWTESLLSELIDGPGAYDFEDVRLERAGSVAGRVVDDRGQAVSGCLVGVVGPATPGSAVVERLRRTLGQAFTRLQNPPQFTATSADGAFRLDHVPVGSVSVIVGLGGERFGYSAPIEIQDQGTREGVEVMLPQSEAGPPAGQNAGEAAPETTMTVRVVVAKGAADSGTPIKGAWVSCIAGPGPSGRVLPVVPQATEDGHFEFTAPTEVFSVIANARNYEFASLGPFEPGSTPSDLTLALTPSAALRGVVIDGHSRKPLTGATVHAHAPTEAKLKAFHFGLLTGWRSQPHSVLSATSDHEGRFSLVLKGTGERLIHVEHEGYARATFGPVGIASLSVLPEPVIELFPGATLTGRLLVHKDADPTAFGVEISFAEGHLYWADVDSSGRYAFEHLPAGPVQIRRRRGHAAGRQATKESGPKPSGIDFRTHPVRSSTDAPTVHAVIPSAGNVSFDLDYLQEVPVDLDLEVALDGAWESGWTAEFFLEGEERYGTTQSASLQSPVPESGHLRLRLIGSGEAWLTLTRRTPSHGEQSLRCDWTANAGSNPRSWSAQSGSLKISGLPTRNDAEGSQAEAGHLSFALVRKSEDGWQWVECFDPTEAGKQSFAVVPAGRIQIRQRTARDQYYPDQWPLIREVDVAPGQEALLNLDEGR